MLFEKIKVDTMPEKVKPGTGFGELIQLGRASKDQQPDEGNGELIAEWQAAMKIKLPLSILRKLTRAGEIACHRKGRKVRYAVTDLQRWIDCNKPGNQAPTDRGRRES